MHYRNYQASDQRYFPLLPFVAGLAVSPLLFRPRYYYPPFPYYYPPYPYYRPYPFYYR
ncbi:MULTISPECIES: hypothetical protein [Bacillus]|uniref:hypothetical protein n=1 Tax=Bacillus TaxID=1386 RepID=UPI00159647BB|nr:MULTISPECIES: hypothetical protein [Bacillus]